MSTAVKLPVPECFCKCWRRAMEMFVAACMLWVIQVTFSWPRCPAATEYLWAHQTPVWFITWHLSSCFISVNGLFPLSAPAAQRKKPEGYWLLFTNQPPHIFFSPCTQSLVRFSFLFFKRAGTKFLRSLGKKLLNEKRYWCLQSYRGVSYTLFWVELFSSRNTFTFFFIILCMPTIRY